MKVLRKGFLVFLLLVMGSTTALAAPQIAGNTGLINIPTADVLGDGGYSVGYHLVDHTSLLNFNASLVPDLELGAAVAIVGGAQAVSLNAKYRILPEKKDAPALAIGGETLNEDYRSLYLAASKTMPDLAGIRAHVGVSTGRGLFLGVSKMFNNVTVRTSAKKSETWSGLPPMLVMAEFDGDDFNAGVQFDLGKGLTLDAYLAKSSGALGVTYTSRF